MKLYAEISKRDEEKRMVWGYASTEAVDSHGEIIKREAIDMALADYMKFANLREMHQASAVGVVKEATMMEKGLFIGAKIVDSSAWEKIKEGVYKGFSIGGQALKRDETNKTTITALRLTEISLVDRPANPEALFEIWKGEGIEMTKEQAVEKLAEMLNKGDIDPVELVSILEKKAEPKEDKESEEKESEEKLDGEKEEKAEGKPDADAEEEIADDAEPKDTDEDSKGEPEEKPDDEEGGEDDEDGDEKKKENNLCAWPWFKGPFGNW
jgi:HK97 family phage prohead protease